jgi:hypothetical protein
MTYVTQSDIALGELVTHTYLNQARDNDEALYAAVFSLAAPTGDDFEKVVNSSDETTMHSFTISADSMGTAGHFGVTASYLAYNLTGGAVNNVLKIKLGSTVLFTSGNMSFANNNYGIATVSLRCFNVDSAAVQVAVSTLVYNGSLAAGATGSTPSVNSHWQNATEDTTGDLTLAITLQLGAAHANCWGEGVAQLDGPFDLS